MAFRVELTKRASTDLEELYLWVVGRAPHQGAAWFNGLEQAILSLDQHPERCPLAPESADPKRPVRVLHFGRARHVYRVLFWIDHADGVVYVLHVRRGGRGALRGRIISRMAGAPMRTAVIGVVTVLGSLAVVLAQGQPLLRLPADQAERVHAAIFKGYAGEIARKLAKTTGDVTLDPPPQPIIDEPQRTAVDDWGLVGILCAAHLVVIGRPASGVSHETADGGYLYTEWPVTVDEVLKDNANAPVRAGSQILVIWPGGTVRIANRLVQAIEPGRRQLTQAGQHLLILRYVPQTGAYSAGSEFRFDGGSVTTGVIRNGPPWPDPHWPTDRLPFIDSVKSAISAGVNCGAGVR